MLIHHVLRTGIESWEFERFSPNFSSYPNTHMRYTKHYYFCVLSWVSYFSPHLATNETLTYFWINIFSFSWASKLSLPFFSTLSVHQHDTMFMLPNITIDFSAWYERKGSLTRENKSWVKIFFIFVMIKFICPQLVLSWMNTQHSHSLVHKQQHENDWASFLIILRHSALPSGLPYHSRLLPFHIYNTQHPFPKTHRTQQWERGGKVEWKRGKKEPTTEKF